MAVTDFIPEVWAGAVLTALDTNLAYAAEGVTNRDYDGEVSEYGGSVVINTAADPTIETYARYTDMTGGQASTTPQTMNIDQLKAWSLDLDDVDRAQARDDGDFVAKVSQRAAHLLAKAADTYVAGLMNAAIPVGNQVAEATISDAAGAYDALVDLGVLLSENDVPVQERWVVVTPGFHGKLLKDSRFVATGDGSAAGTRSSGVVGQAAGFTILVSNNVPDGPGDGAGKNIIAGHSIATTYAEQLSKVEAIRLPAQFTDRLRGLHVYGAKVVKADALVAADVILG